MTSCDLNVGHSDLHPSMLYIDPTEANNTTETAKLLAYSRFVPMFNSVKVRLKMAVVTLKDTPRSNDWYASNVL